jgi:hypothetical protein
MEPARTKEDAIPYFDPTVPGRPFPPLRTWIPILLLLGLPVPPAGHLAAQTSGLGRVPFPGLAEGSPAAVPFGPGERVEYEVRLGRLSVGEGFMEVVGVEPIRDRPSYHVLWTIEGGIPLARVRDRYESWFDIQTLASRRFVQDIHQVRYRSNRHFEIYPEEGRWERLHTEQRGKLSTDLPLDEIAFIYYIRTLDLEVGETYTLERYFREDRNPVVLQVLRRERVQVPGGTFNTIVVRPIIKAGGLFAEGGEAEVYLSDDEERLLVQLRSKVPIVGSLSLHLRALTRGRPIR